MSRKFCYSIGEMTRRLLRTTAPVRGTLIVSTLASIVGNLAQMGLMGFGALTILACAGRLGRPALWGAGMAVSAVLIVLCRYVEGVVSHAGAYQLLAHMRVSLFEKLRTLAPACLVDREKGDILNIAVSDIETIEFFFAHTIGPMFTVILLPCATLLLALSYSPLYAAVLLPIYLIISVVFPLAAVRLGRGVGMRYRERLGRMKSFVLESIYGLKDIQIFGAGPRRLEQVRERNQKINQAAHGLTLHRQAVSSVPTFFVYLARISILAVASYLTLRGTGDPMAAILLSYVATASFSSTQSLTTVISSLLETYAAAERLFILEDTEPEVTEDPSPQSTGPIREIVFDSVDFGYKQGTRDILSGFDLTVHVREKLGIVGESGMGKSTVLRLLLRFWNPRGGEIRINEVPLEKTVFSELRRRIAVLEQDTFLFSGSIAENIAVGRPDASRGEICEAARRAGIHDFIQTLPQGYDTPMGQMSARLSGGERQRIGIARTMIVDPDVLVMDEPTSSLDVLHEKELLKTLADEYGDKMLILVSHRPSTLTGCTRIIRLEQGKCRPVSHADM